MSQKKLVVIGAGNAGTTFVNELGPQANIKVTVLELKDHFDMVIGQPRSLVNGAWAAETLWAWEDVLVGAPEVVKVKEVLEINDGSVKVVMRDGKTEDIPADGVVVATGSLYNSAWMKNNEGLDKEQWLAKMTKCREAIAKAKHVMILGGGITGVELAGEIATEYPAVKVSLVHKGGKLLNGSEGQHKCTMSAAKVLPGTLDIYINDMVDAKETLGEEGPKTYTTQKGVKLEDVTVVINCVGVSPNTKFISKEKLDARGFVEVDEALVAAKLSTAKCKVFAIGDVTKEGAMRAVAARMMGQALAKTVKAWAAGEGALKSVFKPSWMPAIISLGRTEGVANIPICNRFLARLLKSPDMFQLWSISLMKMSNAAMKQFKLSPEAATGPNKDAWKMRAEKAGSATLWVVAGAAATLAIAAGVAMQQRAVQ